MQGILITGGLGYVGRRLAAALVAAGGFDVRILTRGGGMVSPPDGTELARFHGSWQDEGAPLLDGIQQVVHLGGPDEKQCAADPDGTTLEAGRFTRGLMQAATSHGVRNVVLASTIHVYGAALHDEVTEQTLPQPTHPYGIMKRYCEDIVAAASFTGGPRSVALRLANGFGTPLSRDMTRWSLLVNDLCRQAVERKSIEVRADPRTLRNFITMSDVCRAVRHCLETGSGAGPTACFHVGSSRASSLGEMARLVRDRCAAVLGFPPEVVLAPESGAVIPPLHYDISRMSRTGFTPHEDFAGEVDGTLLACRQWFGKVPVSA